MRTLADKLEVHVDTLRKARKRGTTSTKLAKKLENLLGIHRDRFLYPKEFGDPWPEALKRWAKLSHCKQ